MVRTCLSKNPEARFQTAHDLKLQLEWIASPSSQAQAATVARPKRNLKWPVTVAAALLLFLGIAVWKKWPTALPRILDATQVTDDGNQKTGVYVTGTVPAPIVTDGSRLYFPESLTGNYPLVQVSVNGGETASLSTPFSNPGPSDISPNGSEILIFPFVASENEEQVWSLPVPAGSPRRIGSLSGQDAAWVPDGTHIIYSAVHDIFLCQADGSNCKKLVTAGGMPAWMRWSPDGRRLRFTRYDSKTSSASLWEVSADGNNLHPLLQNWQGGPTCCGTWTPDGQYFVFQALHNERSDLWVLREGSWLREPLATQLTAGPLSFVSPVPSRDGKRLYAIGARQRGELVRYDQKSREFLPFLNGISAGGVTFSKDGKQVAYTAYPQGTLWRAKADGSEKLQLTYPPMTVLYPRWSPDGTKLIFSAFSPGGPSRIYRMTTNGGTPEAITAADANEFCPDWSAEGDAIIYGGLPGFMAVDSASQPLRILNLKTGQSSALPGSEGMTCPRWSPDGRHLAAQTNASDKLMLFDFGSKQWQVIASVPSVAPTWSADSQYLYSLEINVGTAHLVRARMSDRKLQIMDDLQTFRNAQELPTGGGWMGLAPDNSPLLLRDRGSEEIYALQWELP